MNYDKSYFNYYVTQLVSELKNRNIKYKNICYEEISGFCNGYSTQNYPEHNDRYLKQCFYNLEEKFDRGIISEEEWYKILEVAYREDIIE